MMNGPVVKSATSGNGIVFVKVDLKMYNKDKRECSFCFSLEGEVDFLIEGPKAEVHICAKCVDLCTELAEDERKARKELKDGE
jgi:hypothetical protein